MSDGQSDYLGALNDRIHALGREVLRRGWEERELDPPIVPRREMWTYTPPYFWLGREAEAA